MNPTLTRIESLLKVYNWSIYQLAKKSGIPYSSLNSLFKRNHQPSISTLEKICLGFGISMSEFFEDSTKPINTLTMYSDDERILIANYRLLSTKGKKLVRDFIEMLNRQNN